MVGFVWLCKVARVKDGSLDLMMHLLRAFLRVMERMSLQRYWPVMVSGLHLRERMKVARDVGCNFYVKEVGYAKSQIENTNIDSR